jgi:hypothetical protein
MKTSVAAGIDTEGMMRDGSYGYKEWDGYEIVVDQCPYGRVSIEKGMPQGIIWIEITVFVEPTYVVSSI